MKDAEQPKSKATKKKELSSFVKNLKETDEYKVFAEFLEEHSKASNHPKLRKLAEILITFFSDP